MANWSVEVENLTRVFGAFTAVDHISFRVRTGQIFGFLGPNGAGKSTTIRMLAGILPPTSGNGRVSGFDMRFERRHIKADRKSTRLNSSHLGISYAVFCLKKKKKTAI